MWASRRWIELLCIPSWRDIAISPELEIIFDTVKSSRKCPNLIARPNCSFVVGWAGEQTVQFEGIASEPNGPDLMRYQETYFAV